MSALFIRRLPTGFSRPLLTALIALVGLTATPISAHAAIITIPDFVNPGQVERRLPTEPSTPSDRLKLNLPAPVESQALPDELRAKLEKTRFPLNSVVIDGATIYTGDDLAFTYSDLKGQTISLLDAREIANRITTFYRNNGYILTQAVVPTQKIDQGILKIRVVEGFIGNVSYIGDENSEGEISRLDAYVQKIKDIRPARMEDLERYMLLLNDLSGSGVTGLIRPSATEFGAADLVLTVLHKQFEASYSFDNRGSKYIGPWQHTAILSANSLFNAYDRTQLRIMSTLPFNQLLLTELQHDEFLDDEGTKLSFTASRTETRPGDSLKNLRIVGSSELYQVKVTHPFIRLRSNSLVARASFDLRNTGVDVFSNQSLTRDRIRVARLGLTYGFLDTWMGSSSLDVQVSQGLNIFEATSAKGTDHSNPLGDSAFTKVNFDLSRLQALGSGFSVVTSATGQFSFQPLLTDEQFSLGGANYGRAFDPSVTLGDSGLAGKVELRYNGTVNEPYFDSYQAFTFLDIGETWVRGAATSEASSTSLASAGVGARLKFTDNFSGAFEVNVPLVKPSNDPTNYRHNPRVFFSVSAQF